ncbi:DUF350 domain-containing protein [Gallaecimonas pentaromativorans]|uniref:Putative membrane protein n=1 Tax=Gallaecimonas pentaromativorans TaxID=584787 RepID=A0A3N1PR80_9GAMM|nr:DUF350 domain-containing protein [Gallaecimonas pentaromativorans]MED5523317.1 DUF350 domain-containing protein [Pseudomonadota bacterium]ROQ30508.1 putative membrane protein [Gallaecimonas pentaromativorans]
MDPVYLQSLAAFVGYFALAAGMLLVFVWIYTWVTPHDEFALIRQNNVAASLAFGGALVGFAIPMASAVANSQSWVDGAIWGLVALVVQLLTFKVLQRLLADLPARISQGEAAAGIFTGLASVAVGLLNAACMTY